MRFSIISSLSILCFAIGCGGSNPPPATPSTPTAPTTTPAASGDVKAPGEAKVGDKTTCPVSGEEFVVTENSPKMEHNGKTYYFCCSGCDAKFKKDPEQFLNKKAKPST